MANIWVDLDKTIWSCYTIYNEEIWAKQLVFPFRRDEVNFDLIEGRNGICCLHKGFRRWLEKTRKRHTVNFISAGRKDNISFEQQPSIVLLKMFNIFELFTFKILEDKEFNKADFLSKLNNSDTLLIDDDIKHIENANLKGISVVDRATFLTWNDCLV